MIVASGSMQRNSRFGGSQIVATVYFGPKRISTFLPAA